MPRNTGCKRQLNYRMGRTRAVCTNPLHRFQTGWLPNTEALHAWNEHIKSKFHAERS